MHPLNKYIKIVLVRPLYERNIGMCSRAMGNLGFEDLIIIAPQTDIGFVAKQGAARSQTALKNKTLYSNWEQFYENEPEGIRVAFSRRPGKLRPLDIWDSLVKEKLSDFIKKQSSIYLIFGPEDVGLNTDDLSKVHFICELESYGEHQSFNLSHAVLISLFTITQEYKYSSQNSEIPKTTTQEANKLDTNKHYFPEETLKEWIELLGFNISNREVNALSTLRRVVLSNTPTEKELRTLNKIIYQNIRKLKNTTQKPPAHQLPQEALTIKAD